MTAHPDNRAFRAINKLASSMVKRTTYQIQWCCNCGSKMGGEEKYCQHCEQPSSPENKRGTETYRSAE